MAKLVSSFNKFFKNIFLDIRSVNPIQTILEIFDGKSRVFFTHFNLSRIASRICHDFGGLGGDGGWGGKILLPRSLFFPINIEEVARFATYRSG